MAAFLFYTILLIKMLCVLHFVISVVVYVIPAF